MLQSMRSAAKYVWIVLVIAFVGGFLLVDSGGLLGRSPVTPNTLVAKVNGEGILYTAWENTVQSLEEQETQRLGRGVTLDERQQLEDRAFDELVNDVLLRQEYERRGISVTDNEILDAARMSPPPGIEQNPQFQTDGQFDLAKYQRFLVTPVARQQGLLAGLEQFYRTEIPRQKLFDQIASDVWVSEGRLWHLYRDRNDSAMVSYVAFRPDNVSPEASSVTDAEISSFYNSNKSLFERPARAVLSLVAIERTVTAADSIATKARIDAIREELLAGADFAETAMRVSNDTSSAVVGGELGRGTRGRFVAPFEEAAYALKEGELSPPVLSSFGWHLIKLDRKRGDTLDLRHILLSIHQSDSSSSATDRTADRLSAIASGSMEAELFDSAAAELGLPVSSVAAIQNEPVTFAGRYVPGASAWAFSGSVVGESSDLLDAPDAYYMVRLDSIWASGIAPLAEVKDEIRRRLDRDKQLEALSSVAGQFAQSARSSSLEDAARESNLVIEHAGPFSRASFVPGLGQFSAPIGAAFGLVNAGAISAPIEGPEGLYVIRLDSIAPADSANFTMMSPLFRLQTVQAMRNERVQQYLVGLRESAKITDERTKIKALLRRQVPI